jgi:hypothetical protein
VPFAPTSGDGNAKREKGKYVPFGNCLNNGTKLQLKSSIESNSTQRKMSIKITFKSKILIFNNKMFYLRKQNPKNMKAMLFILLLMPYLASFAQTQTPKKPIFPLNERGKVEFSQIVRNDSTPGIHVYERMQRWLVLKRSSILLQQPQHNLIIADIVEQITVPNQGNYELHYTISIEGRDGRYQYAIYDILFRVYNYHELRGMEPYDRTAEMLFHPDHFYDKAGNAKASHIAFRDALNLRMSSIIADFQQYLWAKPAKW